jgi:predicted secreted hydrolase
MTPTESNRSKRRVWVKSTSRRRRRLRWRLAIAGGLATLLFGAVIALQNRGYTPVNETAENWYEAKDKPQPEIILPADDAPHAEPVERWEYAGQVRTGKHHTFSFHYRFLVNNTLSSVTVAQASLLDHQTGRRYSAQRRITGSPKANKPGRFALSLDDWSIQGGNGQDRLRIATPEFMLDLSLEETTPASLHGGVGLAHLGAAKASHFYSRARMRVSGHVGLANKRWRVTGQAWFDHRWGGLITSDAQHRLFRLQLSDGSDILFYRLVDAQERPTLEAATFTQNGKSAELNSADYDIRPTSRWTSPKTGISYPTDWAIDIPSKDMQLTLTPYARDAEFDGRASSYLMYWHGPLKVSGSHNGVAFVEASGNLASVQEGDGRTESRTAPPPASTADVRRPSASASAALPQTRPTGDKSAIIAPKRQGSVDEAASHSALVRKIQKALSTRGYDPGPADGLAGRKTTAAIKAFQADQGLKADGSPSQALMRQLLQ